VITEAPPTPARIRYIVQNMRERDRKEIMALRWNDDKTAFANDMIALAGPMWSVWEHNGEPVAISGMTVTRPGVVSISAFGTDKFRFAARHVIAWVRRWAIPRVRATGIHRGEAYALAANTDSRRYIEASGGELEAELFGFGCNKEDFTLYVWRIDDGRRTILHGAGTVGLGTAAEPRRDVGRTGEQRSAAAADGPSDGGPANADAHTAVAAAIRPGRCEPDRQDSVSA